MKFRVFSQLAGNLRLAVRPHCASEAHADLISERLRALRGDIAEGTPDLSWSRLRSIYHFRKLAGAKAELDVERMRRQVQPMRLTDDTTPDASRLRHAAMLALFALAAGALHAAAGNLDRRVRVDPDTAPWRAVGKLQAVSQNFRQTCTGTLVGPTLVLSAAHCLYNPRTGGFFPPASVHFLVGYAGGRYAGHAVGTAVEIGAGYDPDRSKETLGSDWALVRLDKKLGAGDRVLSMFRELPPVGAAVALGGYQRDHPLVLIADTGCRVLGRTVDTSGRALLRHSCVGLPGLSGAPLLIEMGDSWHIAGVAVTEERGAASGLAALPTRLAP